MDLRDLTVKELLQLNSSILNELKRRRIVRTKNNPVGDYTEWIVSKGLGLELGWRRGRLCYYAFLSKNLKLIFPLPD